MPWAWLTEDDLDRYTAAFEQSGFFGPISYYRNLDANYELLADRPPSLLTMPSGYISGDKDPVLAMTSGANDRMAVELPGYRGQTLLRGVGHWTQQEDPRAFNDALLAFLRELD